MLDKLEREVYILSELAGIDFSAAADLLIEKYKGDFEKIGFLEVLKDEL